MKKTRKGRIILCCAVMFILVGAIFSSNVAATCSFTYGVHYATRNGQYCKASWANIAFISGDSMGHVHYARARCVNSITSQIVTDSGRIYAYDGSPAYAESGYVLDDIDFLCQAFYGHQ